VLIIDSALLGIAFFLTPYWTYRKTEQLFSKSDWSNTEKPAEKNIKSKDN